LRHSFNSIGAGRGLGISIIGKLLGHLTPSVASKYSHLAVDPIRRAADQIGEALTAEMSGRPSAAVFP
jgi:site-specific recombinase XerD